MRRCCATLLLASCVHAAPTAEASNTLDPNQAMTAFVASSSEHYTPSKVAQLEQLGFEPRRIDPVFLTEDEHAQRGCKLTAKQVGVFEAHIAMWRELAQQPRKALLLEDDWAIAEGSVQDTAAALREVEARSEDWQLVGHCFGTSCATAYYLTPQSAAQLQHVDACAVGDCPVDWYLESLSRTGTLSAYFSPRQAPFGRDENGQLDQTQDGLFQQDEYQFHGSANRTHRVRVMQEPYSNCRCAMARFARNATTRC